MAVHRETDQGDCLTAMPAQAGFRVEGLTKVVRALQELGLEVDDLKAAFAQLAAEGAEAAARHAPTRSGALAGSIRGNRAKSKAVVTAGRASIPYAGAINYGWPRRGIAASGFMQKADAEIRPKAVATLEAEINRAIQRKGF